MTTRYLALAAGLLFASASHAAVPNWNGPLYFCSADSADGTTFYITPSGAENWVWKPQGIRIIQNAWTAYAQKTYGTANVQDFSCADGMNEIEDTIKSLKTNAIGKKHFARVVDVDWTYSGPPPA